MSITKVCLIELSSKIERGIIINYVTISEWANPPDEWMKQGVKIRARVLIRLGKLHKDDWMEYKLHASIYKVPRIEVFLTEVFYLNKVRQGKAEEILEYWVRIHNTVKRDWPAASFYEDTMGFVSNDTSTEPSISLKSKAEFPHADSEYEEYRLVREYLKEEDLATDSEQDLATDSEQYMATELKPKAKKSTVRRRERSPKDKYSRVRKRLKGK